MSRQQVSHLDIIIIDIMMILIIVMIIMIIIITIGGVSSTFRDSKSAPFKWREQLTMQEVTLTTIVMTMLIIESTIQL